MPTETSAGLRAGLVAPPGFWSLPLDARAEATAEIVAAGIDHLYLADHVSFHDGSGTDGFVEVAALSQLHPTLNVMISIYLLPLRHPLPVARQLATMHKIAPGRMLFGVGIGGEDRHEIEVCGVDPSTRGRRMNESLELIRALMSGQPVDFAGEFFAVEAARIRPAIEPRIPIVVGGRSNAALKRAGRLGDGWIGVWCSERRYREALGIIADEAEAAGRGQVDWLHGYQPWVGVADTREEARRVVAAEMEAFYKIPFERFEKYTPYGRPDEVAAQLAGHVDAGCRLMNLKVCAPTDAEVVSGAGEIIGALRNRA
ncbi:MAG: LLM class flavin-dependent oxidoreductase [Pseudomonadota bacterium]